jgi:hypothetical protein
MKKETKEKIKELEKQIKKENPGITKSKLNNEVLRLLADDQEERLHREEIERERKNRKYQYQEIHETVTGKRKVDGKTEEFEIERSIFTDFKITRGEIKELVDMRG